MIKLQDHWRASLDALGLDTQAAEPVYQGLVQRYRESGRFYHNLGHIEALLEWRDRFAAELNEPDLVSLAIWFHDAIYSTLRKGNESRSATLALRQLQPLGLDRARLDKLAMMIRQTADHHGALQSKDRDLQWFLDFDLSILGSVPKTYARYASQIRKEYRLVPDVLYFSGRAKVLHHLLQAEFLYYTPAFRRSHEKQARENMLLELRKLEAREILGLD